MSETLNMPSGVERFCNNFIHGQFNKEGLEASLLNNNELIINELLIHNVEVVLQNNTKITAIGCLFFNCRFLVAGKLNPESFVASCIFDGCDTRQLQQALNGYSVG